MGKSLVIVESPAKARTIEKYLGEDFRVEASVGHIRDLPRNASEVPSSIKKEKWAQLGVNVDDGFAPVYVVPADKKPQVKLLKEALKDADVLYLATDEDREGESISWHLLEVLKPKVPVRRLVFNEITKEAIQRSLEKPRAVDLDLVRAQETRRIVDRLFGYQVSNLVWRKVKPKLSAGRVQSVAVRLLVERERRRLAFVPAGWWDVSGVFGGDKGTVEARLLSWTGRRLASGRDFGEDGQLLDGRDVLVLDEALATRIAKALEGGVARVDRVEEKPYKERPAAPFTTSTLQQEANRKLRWTARRTMTAAQRLYESGWITYMRTDSTTLSSEAVGAARSLIKSTYGPEYLPPKARVYATKSKGAQEAHEAIRPAGSTFRTLEEAGAELSGDEIRLYELIWKRTVACQMEDARGRTVQVRILAGDGEFSASGKTVDFPGYRRAYVEGSDNPEAELADQERILPPLVEGDDLAVDAIEAKGHTTKSPARLTEATLVKELEQRGIGRPSTYASIIDTIIRREYVFKKGSALVPTFTAFAVTALLEQHLTGLVDYDFTARMEAELDDIAAGQDDSLAYLERFYTGERGLQALLELAADAADPRQICSIPLALLEDGTQLEVRVGRYGPYLEAGETRADLPDDLPPDELSLERAKELISKRKEGPRVVGQHPELGKPIFLMEGRFGPYVQLGEPEIVKGPRGGRQKIKPPTAGLLRGMTADSVDLETALKLLSLPRDLGPHPESGESVFATNGPYGPYLKCKGQRNTSLPDDIPLFDVTMAQAVELFKKPPGRRRNEPLKELGADPQAENAPIKVMQGRFGPYVTNGSTNASLPKGLDVEAVSLEMALEMLRKREQAPARPKRGRKAPARKAAAPAKKPVAKAQQAPAKKAPAKKPAAKAKKPAAKAKKPAKKA